MPDLRDYSVFGRGTREINVNATDHALETLPQVTENWTPLTDLVAETGLKPVIAADNNEPGKKAAERVSALLIDRHGMKAQVMSLLMVPAGRSPLDMLWSSRMEDKQTITFAEALKLAPTLRLPTRQISGKGNYRATCIGDGHTLTIDHRADGTAYRAIFLDKDGNVVPCYRRDARGSMGPVTPDVYDWGYEVEPPEFPIYDGSDGKEHGEY